MNRILGLGFLVGAMLAVPAVTRADNPPQVDGYDDIHKRDPPHENTAWPKQTKTRVKELLDWPAATGQQVGETGESTKGQTRDEKRARTSPRELPIEKY
jgi:hypothetical protein